MDPRSHNLTVGYYGIGPNAFQYNGLRSGDKRFVLEFIRAIENGAINFSITKIIGVDGSAPTPEDILFLEGEVNFMQNTPLNGDECVALGWTYLGHTSTNKANIEAAVATAVSKGYSFKSLFYMKGYFVYGCEALKLFYDQQ